MDERNFLESNLPLFLAGATGATICSPLKSCEKTLFLTIWMKDV